MEKIVPTQRARVSVVIPMFPLACSENTTMDFPKPLTAAPLADVRTTPADLPWEDAGAALGPAFSAALPPTPLPAPHWIAHDAGIGAQLGLPAGWWESEAFCQAFSGNAPCGTPRASVYAGHQFGVWAGQLGDGRALTLGALASQEVQLKGAGRTPFSRGGDGRAVLRSSIREYLACGAMRGLGIPSTDALCLIGSALPVRRENVETAAVVTRAAASFVRFGHFEYCSYLGQPDMLERLLTHTVDRHFPAVPDRAQQHWHGNRAAALLAEVTQRSADLVAQWQAVGFCHGVLNTDNMSILGLTLDYGPFQFLDAFNPHHICNHTDAQGRYAFDQQPDIVHWNLYALAQALLPALDGKEQAVQALAPFTERFHAQFLGCMAAKLGCSPDAPALPAVLQSLLSLLASQAVDYPIFWRRLSHWVRQRDRADPSVSDLFRDPAPAREWLVQYTAQLPDADWNARADRMLRSNPLYVLRNHVAETAIRAAQAGDFTGVQRVQRILARPFDEQSGAHDLADFPPAWADDLAISCSS